MAVRDDPLAELFSAPDAGVYSMSSNRPFLVDLASALLKKYANQPASLAELMIFLPTRRAARALAEAFLVAAGSAPAAILLPRIRTLGDLEEDDLLAEAATGNEPVDLPPAISTLERRLVLARFVHRHRQWLDKMGGPAARWSTALRAADDLAGMLDSFYTEQVPFERLADLVPAQFSAHWQNSLAFLEIVTEQWPAYLAAQGRLDPADHRRLVIDALADHWRENAPAHPVLIAGSTGSMPAVARLMRLVAAMPQGAVVLPGLDCRLDEAAWQEIEDPHPQAGLKYLLENYFDKLQRIKIAEWPLAAGASSFSSNRDTLLSLALRPAQATDDWHLQVRAAEAALPDAVQGLGLVEASDEAMEAQIIALAMRETLEVPDKGAILVTPDRGLARRVSARLGRWGIRLDDSGGVPFANTLRGNFLRLVASWLADVSDPVRLLCLLKHPLCTVGMEGAELAACVQALDLSLRGLRPGRGFDGLRARLGAGAEWDALAGADDEGQNWRTQMSINRWALVRPLIDRLEEIAQEFLGCSTQMRALLGAHLLVSERLAAGPDRLWAYEDGEVGAALMARLYEHIDFLPDQDRDEYPDVFDSLVAGVPVRMRGGTHPRLMILGPLEARLQQADLMILGGLNERIWPDDSKSDPFLSRPMRAQLGLPSHQRRVGLAAHDFAQGASAGEVLLTRAKQAGRSPTKPSRWIVRLKNILAKADLLAQTDQTARYEAWARAMDAPEGLQLVSSPGPCPPVEARPTRLPVSAIEKLLRDPYNIFASRILKLYRLDGLDLDPDFAIRGRFYHSVFAQFAKDYPNRLPAQPLEILHAFADRLFERTRLDDAVRAFWRVRMEESFAWFIGFHEQMLSRGQAAIVEGKGGWTFPLAGADFTLEARADRIDMADGGAFIVDYKTGRIPSGRQDKTFVPQLPLTALIVENGGFEALGVAKIAGYAYVKVLNRKGNKTDQLWVEGEDLPEILGETKTSLIKLLAHYADPSTPYLSQPRPFYRDEYGNYDDLARRGEWIVEAEDD